MNTHFSINKPDVHLWRACLTDLQSQTDRFLTCLNPDEIQRANRFHFPEHRERFILTRGILRHILALYTGEDPQAITFSYGEHGKPRLDLSLPLQFNTSHSHDMAVYAFTLENEIGIDIEKIESKLKLGVAKRFFSHEEYAYLTSLRDTQQISAFYTIWARKEAVIKSIGKGLFTSLEAFSVLQDSTLIRTASSQVEEIKIETIHVHPDYQAAFAMKAPIGRLHFWEWSLEGQVAWR